jgi:hypothetical protein
MPTCGPDYANVGYKEYFDVGCPNCTQYTNAAGTACAQYCTANSRSYIYGNAGYLTGCGESICSQTCANYNLYGAGNGSLLDDCSQYFNYSNCSNYTRNATGAGSVLPALGLNQPLIDGITDVPTSITAIEHLRDKMSTLVDIKLRQTTVNNVQSAAVADATFNDGNPATIEQVAATQYNALKSKLDSFWAALKASGTTLGTATSVPARTAGADPVQKSNITALKNDLVTIANACTQSYANYQNQSWYANANSYCNNQVYGRTAYYRDMVCSNSGYTNYFNSNPCWDYTNYANHSNHSSHGNHSNYNDYCNNCSNCSDCNHCSDTYGDHHS